MTSVRRPGGHCGADSSSTASSASARRPAGQIEAADVLVAGRLVAAAGVGVGPSLDLVALDGVGLDARADVGDDLLGLRAIAGGEVFHSRWAWYIDSVNAMPLTALRRPSASSSSSTFSSMGMANGSSSTGVSNRPLAGGRSSSTTGVRRAVADARAMRTARAATRSASAVSSLPEEAKPHAPSTSTRTPKPSVSPSETPSTRPDLTVTCSSWRRTTRTSAYSAPCCVAVSRARCVRSRMGRDRVAPQPTMCQARRRTTSAARTTPTAMTPVINAAPMGSISSTNANEPPPSDAGVAAGIADGPSGDDAAGCEAPGSALETGCAATQSGGSGPGGAGCGPRGSGKEVLSEAAHASSNAAMSAPVAVVNASSSVTPPA